MSIAVKNKTLQLIAAVKDARQSYLDAIQATSEAQALWKPSADGWNLVNIT